VPRPTPPSDSFVHVASSATRLTSEFSSLWVELDGHGAPSRLGSSEGNSRAIRFSTRLSTEGDEVRGPDGGLVYPNTVDVVPDAAPLVRRSIATATTRRHRVETPTTSPSWSVVWEYEFRSAWPALAVTLRVRCHDDAAVLRNVHTDILFDDLDAERSLVHAPGNQLRPGVRLCDVTAPFDVLPISAVSGSTGLLAFEHCDDGDTLVVWPMSMSEIGDTYASPGSSGLRYHWQADVGGAPGAGGELVCGPIRLDLVHRSFAELLSEVPDVLEAAGITSHADPPAWSQTASIYEVQIGFGVFPGGWQYSPYPTAEDLLADLDRIQGLGFDTLQVMPRQPFPSYNVHDYADISTTYGDENVLREVVRSCHARGMHVICDLLLHGVIDGEVVREAMDAVHSGPYATRLDEDMPDITTLTREESDAILLTWSRHVVDFGPHWIAGSPGQHPLVSEHPEWFCTDSAGHITSRYTRAFDVAHPEWQQYFIDAALDIVRRLDVDGFRLDAPSYNYFHNWSPRTRANASVSMLGALPLFETLRHQLRALKPDCLLYTEPAGPLWRMSMDLNYNYDELWLIRAVLTNGRHYPQGVRNARELGEWLDTRDAGLPRGSMTAHHIDSHDTFWWPAVGQKWRREQFGLDAAAAMLTVFALSGEPYMTFVGGEEGIEERVAAVHRLRRGRRELAIGTSDRQGVRVSSDDVYRVIRTAHDPGAGTGRSRTLVLVNLSASATVAEVSVPAFGGSMGETPDLLSGSMPPITWTQRDDRHHATLTLPAFGAVVVALDHA
jgi:glycosidase